MYEKFGQFIDGKWQQSSSGETYEVINPATEEIIGKAYFRFWPLKNLGLFKNQALHESLSL